MTEVHPNVAVLSRFDPRNVAGSADVVAEDVVFHFFNPNLPDIQGDYVGLTALQEFFGQMAEKTAGTFRVNPISVTAAVGDELVVVQSKNTMILEDRKIETDVVVVWRIVDGRITEVWDIPSVHTARVSKA